MDGFWNNALKAGGATGIVLFILSSLGKDLIIKSSPLPAELTFLLIGLLLFFLFIIALNLIKKNNINRDSNVLIDGDSSGTIVTGDGNNINSDKENSNPKQQSGDRDSNVSIGGSNSGNVITGDGNNIKS